MADPLSYLREYNINKKNIVEKNDYILFDEYLWPKSTKTSYQVWGSGKNGADKEYYTLEALFFLLKNVRLGHVSYVNLARERNVPYIRRPDRKKLLAYLHGETSTSPSIDASAPVVFPIKIKQEKKGSTKDGKGGTKVPCLKISLQKNKVLSTPRTSGLPIQVKLEKDEQIEIDQKPSEEVLSALLSKESNISRNYNQIPLQFPSAAKCKRNDDEIDIKPLLKTNEEVSTPRASTLRIQVKLEKDEQNEIDRKPCIQVSLQTSEEVSTPRTSSVPIENYVKLEKDGQNEIDRKPCIQVFLQTNEEVSTPRTSAFPIQVKLEKDEQNEIDRKPCIQHLSRLSTNEATSTSRNENQNFFNCLGYDFSLVNCKAENTEHDETDRKPSFKPENEDEEINISRARDDGDFIFYNNDRVKREQGEIDRKPCIEDLSRLSTNEASNSRNEHQSSSKYLDFYNLDCCKTENDEEEETDIKPNVKLEDESEINTSRARDDGDFIFYNNDKVKREQDEIDRKPCMKLDDEDEEINTTKAPNDRDFTFYNNDRVKIEQDEIDRKPCIEDSSRLSTNEASNSRNEYQSSLTYLDFYNLDFCKTENHEEEEIDIKPSVKVDDEDEELNTSRAWDYGDFIFYDNDRVKREPEEIDRKPFIVPGNESSIPRTTCASHLNICHKDKVRIEQDEIDRKPCIENLSQSSTNGTSSSGNENQSYIDLYTLVSCKTEKQEHDETDRKPSFEPDDKSSTSRARHDVDLNIHHKVKVKSEPTEIDRKPCIENLLLLSSYAANVPRNENQSSSKHLDFHPIVNFKKEKIEHNETDRKSSFKEIEVKQEKNQLESCRNKDYRRSIKNAMSIVEEISTMTNRLSKIRSTAKGVDYVQQSSADKHLTKKRSAAKGGDHVQKSSTDIQHITNIERHCQMCGTICYYRKKRKFAD